jgi:predicted anti-sigma-YlaC factor YlaD
LGLLFTCKEASRLISQELEGPLPFGRRMRLRLHLLECNACRRFLRQVEYLRAAMRRYRS